MSCTTCSSNKNCMHTKCSTIRSILKNGKLKKPPEDVEAQVSSESSQSEVSEDRPPGFMKFLKRCFKLHFRGNSSKRHKSKMVKASEPLETVPSVAEVSSVISPSVSVNNAPESRTLSSDSTLPSDTVNLFPNPSTPSTEFSSTSLNLATPSPNPVTHSPSLPNYSSILGSSPNPGNSKHTHSDTTNSVQHTHKSLAVELLNLSRYGWYWGPITQAEAVQKLLDQPDGSFLVRDSYADHYLVSMSFKTMGKIYHTRINHNNGQFFFYTSPQHSCASIQELIEVSMDSSKSSIFCYSRPSSPFSPSLPIRLTKPVSRFTQVRSLQHLCRFVIRQYTRIDQIKDLPLPNSLCGYLEAKQF